MPPESRFLSWSWCVCPFVSAVQWDGWLPEWLWRRSALSGWVCWKQCSWDSQPCVVIKIQREVQPSFSFICRWGWVGGEEKERGEREYVLLSVSQYKVQRYNYHSFLKNMLANTHPDFEAGIWKKKNLFHINCSIQYRRTRSHYHSRLTPHKPVYSIFVLNKITGMLLQFCIQIHVFMGNIFFNTSSALLCY